MRSTLLTTLLFFLGCHFSYTQSLPEVKLCNVGIDIPLSLFDSRSAVIISTNEKNEEWKKSAHQTHRQLIRMNIDPVLYLHYQDFHASPYISRKFQQLFEARGISNLFIIDIRNKSHELAIIPMRNGQLLYNESSWYEEAFSLNDVIFKLALQIKKLDVNYKNFLVPEYPEIVDDILVFKGKQYPNYPSRLTKATLAIALTPLLSEEQVSDPEKVTEYNASITRWNETIKSAFAQYPFPHEFVYEDEDEALFKKRFQYVLRIINTSGNTIKKILNYEIDPSQTDYISVVPLPNGSRTMKTIDMNRTVFKCYIQQTARSDVHVGRYWDADESVTAAIQNFITHLQNNVQ